MTGKEEKEGCRSQGGGCLWLPERKRSLSLLGRRRTVAPMEENENCHCQEGGELFVCVWRVYVVCVSRLLLKGTNVLWLLMLKGRDMSLLLLKGRDVLHLLLLLKGDNFHLLFLVRLYEVDEELFYYPRRPRPRLHPLSYLMYWMM